MIVSLSCAVHQEHLQTIVGRTTVFIAPMIERYGEAHSIVRGEKRPERACGRVLRSGRQSRGLSQEELAARAGYHRTYVGQLERGEKSPSLRTIFNLSSALEVRPSALIRRVERSM